jgi:hypothetical protein
VVVQATRTQTIATQVRSWRTAVAGIVLFGLGFGYVEAACVVYLRHIYDPIRRELHPERKSGDLFPMITTEELRGQGLEVEKLLLVELGREAATLIMLASVAAAVAGNRREWFAGFCAGFGVWDLAFYLFLKVILGWPESLLTWDILFLLPLPWVGPVLAPVIVAATLAVCGALALKREIGGAGLRIRASHWVLLVLGGVIIITSFMWDFRNTMAGHLPNPFNWPLFAAGEALGLAVFLHAWFAPRNA